MGDKESGRRGERVKLTTHRDLDVYKMAFEAAMRIFDLTKTFPKEETYYDLILGKLVTMIQHPEQWVIRR